MTPREEAERTIKMKATLAYTPTAIRMRIEMALQDCHVLERDDECERQTLVARYILEQAVLPALTACREECARVAEEFESDAFGRIENSKDKLRAIDHILGIAAAIRKLGASQQPEGTGKPDANS